MLSSLRAVIVTLAIVVCTSLAVPTVQADGNVTIQSYAGSQVIIIGQGFDAGEEIALIAAASDGRNTAARNLGTVITAEDDGTWLLNFSVADWEPGGYAFHFTGTSSGVEGLVTLTVTPP